MPSVGDMHSWCEMRSEFLNSIAVAVMTSTDYVVDLLHIGKILNMFHDFRLLCVRSVDVMTSSHLFFFSVVILSTSLVPASMVVSPCMLHRDSVIPPIDQGCTVLILYLEIT